ncbi:head-tail connector protein [Candidatus Halocynthiibacter alkanivorans]|uniref:head-tail connector protein n=1 Tax=Candidatus Halocynthiibacter alkanivorans TaxID=2267619 RepID=UPI000DF10E58|nr:head-tail connector protein [Candidatus Halocynthiibacter alkanivorans]
MWSGVQVTTPPAPASLPIEIDVMKLRLRCDEDEENAVITDMIRQAVDRIDGPDGIGVAMMTQTWTRTLDAFSAEIRLPGSPIQSVSEIRYMDSAGDWQTLASATYRLCKSTHPWIVVPAPGAHFPTTLRGRAVVEIDYVLGNALAADVPADLVAAVTLLVGHYFENREAVVTGTTATELPMGVERILARHARIGAVA